MINILEEYYKQELHVDGFTERKVQLSGYNYQISGIIRSGKTTLIKKYLKEFKKSLYLYIDLEDIRIDKELLNSSIQKFCITNKIETLVYENYDETFFIPNVKQVILTCKENIELENVVNLPIYPLDFEEFLAYEHNFDSTALNHFIKLGGLPVMHNINANEQILYIQKALKDTLSPIEFTLLVEIAQSATQKLSAFNLYTKLKEKQKISKDSLYKAFANLELRRYLHVVAKFNHERAVKKLYMADVSFIYALHVKKNFIRIFETLVLLELVKKEKAIFYEEGISFYIPNENRVILCMPFADERALFKKIESIEAFIFTHQVEVIEAVTMSSETTLSHPMASIEMIEFSRWALMD